MLHIEDEEQRLIIEWSKLKRLSELKHAVLPNSRISDYLVASANGGKRNAKEAARMKLQGVSAGFPDLQLCIAAGEYHGLFIELKRPIVKGKAKPVVSDYQSLWIERLSRGGYLARVCYGYDEAIKTIEQYLKGAL